MVGALEKAIGRPAILDRQPMQPGDVEITCADITRAAEDFGYRPKVTLPDGLARFVDWFKKSGHLYKLPGE
jgi:UDP-glucuronate 4-epimerase